MFQPLVNQVVSLVNAAIITPKEGRQLLQIDNMLNPPVPAEQLTLGELSQPDAKFDAAATAFEKHVTEGTEAPVFAGVSVEPLYCPMPIDIENDIENIDIENDIENKESSPIIESGYISDIRMYGPPIENRGRDTW